MGDLSLERQNEIQESMRPGIRQVGRFSTMVQKNWMELYRKLRHYLCGSAYPCLHRTYLRHYQLKLGCHTMRTTSYAPNTIAIDISLHSIF